MYIRVSIYSVNKEVTGIKKHLLRYVITVKEDEKNVVENRKELLVYVSSICSSFYSPSFNFSAVVGIDFSQKIPAQVVPLNSRQF